MLIKESMKEWMISLSQESFPLHDPRKEQEIFSSKMWVLRVKPYLTDSVSSVSGSSYYLIGSQLEYKKNEREGTYEKKHLIYLVQ